LCEVGFEAQFYGTKLCDICQAGTFANSTGTVKCEQCSPGYVNNGEGMSACEACPEGTAQPEASQTSCITCPAGTYTDAEGSDTCMQCPRGTYQPTEKSQWCLGCPDGKTTKGDGAKGVTECYWEQCPIGYHRVKDSIECAECPQGTFASTLESAECTPCALGHFNPIRRQKQCLECPTKLWTKAVGAIHITDCIGPIMKICSGPNFTGTCKTYNDIAEKIPFEVKSLKVIAGKWNFWMRENFSGVMYTRNYPFEEVELSFKPKSFESDIENSFCYVGKGESYTPSRFYNETIDGDACVNWKLTQHPEVGSNTFCANPEENKGEPWCYTRNDDTSITWKYCNVPKCLWDNICYVGRGQGYRGTASSTRDGYTCQNWQSDFPHPHYHHSGHGIGNHNYARNPTNSAAPWCYLTQVFTVWDYTSAPKCNRKDHPFYHD
jgi:hypothetical protein